MIPFARFFLCVLLGSILPGLLIAGEDDGKTITFRGVLKNTEGRPLPNLRILATRQDGDREIVETQTDAAGAFALELEPVQWFVEADPNALLERGYFCVPGSMIDPGDPFGSATINFTAVATRPEITVERTSEAIRFVIDWERPLDGVPDLLRNYELQRSCDLENWERVKDITSADVSESVEEPMADQCVFYRAVLQNLIIVNIEVIESGEVINIGSFFGISTDADVLLTLDPQLNP